ncbi:hypothetical protein V1506DRAFT_555891 [Lipomyces tetrasporus]
MAEHSDLLEILEVQASREEYERVQAILENDESKYPRLWYDGTRNVAIVAAPPSALHANMAGELMASIIRLSSEISNGVHQWAEMGNTRGRTTRGWDGAIQYREGNRTTLMIAIEEDAAVDEAEEDFRHQLTERPYGPLVRDGVTWFGRIQRVVLEIYCAPDENITESMVLDPSRYFTIVEDGGCVGGDVPPNLQEVVLGDCIADHILSGEALVARPVNFFRRACFEAQFQEGMVRTAGNRMRPRPQ